MSIIDPSTDYIWKDIQIDYLDNWEKLTKFCIEKIDVNQDFTTDDLHVLEASMHLYIAALFIRMRILRGTKRRIMEKQNEISNK